MVVLSEQTHQQIQRYFEAGLNKVMSMNHMFIIQSSAARPLCNLNALPAHISQEGMLSLHDAFLS